MPNSTERNNILEECHMSFVIRNREAYIGYWIFADIFQLILADTDTKIFPFVWKQHQVSPVQKL